MLTPPNERSDRLPWGHVVPKSAADPACMVRCFAKTTFLGAGKLTHTRPIAADRASAFLPVI